MSITGFLGRNGLAGWALLAPATALAEHRLMESYKKRYPVCACCGEDNPRRLEVHHVIPLWDTIEQAGCDYPGMDRFLVLCDHQSHNCHLLMHAGNFGKRYVENARIVASLMRRELEECIVVERKVYADPVD